MGGVTSFRAGLQGALAPNGVGSLWVSLPWHSEIAEIPPGNRHKDTILGGYRMQLASAERKKSKWEIRLAYSKTAKQRKSCPSVITTLMRVI